MTSSAGINLETKGFQYKHSDRPLEGYTIQRAAGRGGFGEVYYAVSDGGREVALKLIHTYEQIELRGISHCMNLKSPHLVTIFDVKYGIDGRPWVIMEFVSGPSLRELLDAAPSGLGISKAAFFLREIAKSLTYLHDCGIVHRDLKPGNIFYENGYVKIGDYGLSKAILAGQNSAQTITVGTVHYMAPEIGEGHYDKGIDLYALGALLYEMLTGQVPFFGASPTEVLMKHLSAQVDLSHIEEPFATVIRKAMAKNPAERYQSAQEMVEAVFGSEHVRNSVSHFAPESLSMVAGHVARKISLESAFAGTSSVTRQPHRDVLGQLGQRVHALMNQGFEAALKPCRRIGRRLDRFIATPDEPTPSQPTPEPTSPTPAIRPLEDPISTPQRRTLAAVAAGLAAIACGIVSDSDNAAGATFFSFLAIFGGTLGVLIGLKRIAPGLPAEPKYLHRLATGGFAGLCAAFFALPLALTARPQNRTGEIWLAIVLSVLLLDWKRRTQSDRRTRINLGQIIVALILGAVSGAIFNNNPPLIAGIVAGIALAVQILAPWNPGAITAMPTTNPVEPAPISTSPNAPISNPTPTGGNMSPMTSSIPVPQQLTASPQEFSLYRLAGGAGRLLASVIAMALLLASVLMGIAIAMNLPALFNSNLVDHDLRDELRQTFGKTDWPRLICFLASVAALILATIAIAILMQVRKRSGLLHMLRAPAAAAMLFAFVLFLAPALPAWSELIPTDNGWELADQYVKHIASSRALAAVVPLLAALLLLIWPAHRRSRSTTTPPMQEAA